MTEPSTVRLGRLYAERARLEAEIRVCERTVIEDIQRRQQVTRTDLGREIIIVVAATMGVPDNFLTSRNRTHPYIQARAVAYTIARRSGWTLPRIAAWAGRDHTSVMHAIEGLARGYYTSDVDLADVVDRVYVALNGDREAS